jgi:hypothetical protein
LGTFQSYKTNDDEIIQSGKIFMNSNQPFYRALEFRDKIDQSGTQK